MKPPAEEMKSYKILAWISVRKEKKNKRMKEILSTKINLIASLYFQPRILLLLFRLFAELKLLFIVVLSCVMQVALV